MASRVEHEMLFKLNAELGSSYSSSFTKAQQQLVAMQQEITTLNSVQSNISAYEKQQTAVDNTSKKLETLQQQYDNIQKEIQETEGYSSSLENKLLSKQQQIDKTTTSLTQQEQKLQQMGVALSNAGVDTANLTSESARLEAEVNNLKEQQTEAAKEAEEFGDVSSNAFGAISDAIAAAGVVVALKQIYDAYAACISIAGEFESSMSNVEAISGATAEEMALLTAEAKDLGASTIYISLEVADAMGYMGMAGWDATEMLSGMSAVLELASASGEDLASVADIVTDNLTAFGLTAEDTAMFSDVLATAATNSNTSVSIMGETFKNSASVAGALGYSVQDVAVAVGLMANSGVKGSTAGTALKNTFTGLLSGVTLTADAFGDYDYTVVNADGTMKDFSDTIDDLRGYFNQMTEAEQVNNAVTIAGTRGYNGLLAILNATDEEYASLTDSINDSTGAASAMAEVKLDNMLGDLALMESAWDGLSTTVGELFIPEMRSLYTAGTAVLNLGDEFVQDYPYIVKGGTAVVAILGAGTVGLTAYSTATKVATAASVALGAALPALGAIAAIAVGAGVVVGALSTLTDDMEYETIPTLKELTTATDDLNDVMSSSSNTCEDTVDTTYAAASVAETYIRKLEEMGEYSALATEEQAEYMSILSVICQVVPELAEYIDMETGAIEGGTDALLANTEAWKENAITQAYQEQLVAVQTAHADVLVEQAKNTVGLADANIALTLADDAVSEAQERMLILYREAEQAAIDLSEEQGAMVDPLTLLSNEYLELEASMGELTQDVVDAQIEVGIYTEALEENAEAVEVAEEEIDLVTRAVDSLTGATEESTEAVEDLTRGEAELTSVISITLLSVEELATAYAEAYDAAYESVSGQHSLWEEVATPVATTAQTINSALDSQIAYWQSYNENLDTLTAKSGEIEGLGEVLASFADGSEDSIAVVAGMATASDEDLTRMVEQWNALRAEQETTADSLAEIETNFTETMGYLQEELASTIAAMDLGAEAATSGENTIQAFIDSAIGLKPQVAEAYASIAQTAIDAIDTTFDIHSPSRVMMDRAQMTWAGFINETYVLQGDVSDAMAGTAVAGVEAFSVGEVQTNLIASYGAAATNYAVTPANAVSNVGGGGSTTVYVTFQIDGNATTDTVEALERYGDDFAERVLTVISNARIDASRRVFA